MGVEKKNYRKFPTISPRIIFVFSGELIFGGACYWREFCVSKWVGRNNMNRPTLGP